MILLDQQESDLDPTLTFASVTQTSGTATFSVTSLTCTARTVDLGAFSWTETTPTTSRSVAIITNAVASSPKLVAVQNLTDGSQWNTPTIGPVIVDDLSFKVAYQGEA